MFNDIDKKLKFTWWLNTVCALFLFWITFSFAKFPTEFNNKGIAVKFVSPAIVGGVLGVVTILAVLITILSFFVYKALKNEKETFRKLEKSAKLLRALAWVNVVAGIIGEFLYFFWGFLRITSDNAFVDTVSYALIAAIPILLMIYCVSCCLYGLGNAADGGGDAKYVKESKLTNLDDIHEGDTRAICPDCGTRTNRATCPNCGARVKK